MTGRETEETYIPTCPHCRRPVLPRQTQIDTGAATWHFGCEREYRINERRAANGTCGCEGRHLCSYHEGMSDAGRCLTCDCRSGDDYGPCPCGCHTARTNRKITAFGCFRDHDSHASAADQWQCIREHFAEMDKVIRAAIFMRDERDGSNNPTNWQLAEADLCGAVDAYEESMRHD